ncbi:MAG TPA: YHS domain-containing protein [Rhodocyclaceae bacterium]|jgi:YHS domain-containing protein
MSTETSRDPVCGKDVVLAESAHSLQHRGLTFHFCSRQCQQRFEETPELYTGARRSADIHPIPKRRKLIAAQGAEGALTEASQRLAAMTGVSSVRFDGCSLRIDYDLLLVSLTMIEAVANEAGLSFKEGLHGLRRSLWKFTERNELENAVRAGTGACCSRPPTRLR